MVPVSLCWLELEVPQLFVGHWGPVGEQKETCPRPPGTDVLVGQAGCAAGASTTPEVRALALLVADVDWALTVVMVLIIH